MSICIELYFKFHPGVYPRVKFEKNSQANVRKFLCADYLFVLLKACRVRMSTHTKTGPELLKWLDEKGLQLPSGEEAAVGDVVVCSVRNNFLDPCDLGTVHTKNTNGEQFVLPDGHKDGSLVDMFVLTYTKSRVNKRKIKCKFDLFVFVCICLHMFISFLFVVVHFIFVCCTCFFNHHPVVNAYSINRMVVK